ncbi:hypothetical protein RB195_009735 [Necator americanus]|uniref:Transposase n=1 Tax=Necator americanus TaxID=51031 RepID=A0ABR1CY07_NECAM
MLTQYDMDCPADTALSLLTLKRTHTWLEHLVTGDEKWISYSNIQPRAQWVDKGTDAEDVPKPNVHAKKVVLCIWWSVHGVKYWELLDEGCTVTADVYVEQLKNLKSNLETARPQQLEVYFHHDNARPHIAKTTKAELTKFGWNILPHPPYSPDLAPSDYHLFSCLQRHLDGQDFQTRDDIKKALEQFFKEQSPAFWSKGIYDLPKRWQKTIDANGAYFK